MLIVAVFLSFARDELCLLLISLQGLSVECSNGRISPITEVNANFE